LGIVGALDARRWKPARLLLPLYGAEVKAVLPIGLCISTMHLFPQAIALCKRKFGFLTGCDTLPHPSKQAVLRAVQWPIWICAVYHARIAFPYQTAAVGALASIWWAWLRSHPTRPGISKLGLSSPRLITDLINNRRDLSQIQ